MELACLQWYLKLRMTYLPLRAWQHVAQRETRQLTIVAYPEPID